MYRGFSPDKPLPLPIRPCVQCKFFYKHTCEQYGVLNLVTGEIQHASVEIARAKCQGLYYSPGKLKGKQQHPNDHQDEPEAPDTIVAGE